MFKNVASQKFTVFAFDATTNLPKSGDAANITAYVSIDNGSVTVLGDTSATEKDATNAKGYYLFDATQAETNGDKLEITAKSSTANIVVIGGPACIYTRPTTGWLAPATAGRTLVVDASGLADANVVKVGPTGSGTAQTARDIGASVLLSSGAGTGQLDFTAGVVKANATQWLGGTIPAVNVTGVPLVDLKYTLGTISPATAGSVRCDSVTGAVGSVTGAVGSVTGNVGGNVTGSVGSVVGAVGSVTGAVGSVTGAVGSVTGAVGSVTGNVGGNVVGTVASVVGAVGSVTGLTAANLDATISSRLASATYVPPTTALTESYSALHAAPSMAQLLFEIRSLLAEKSVAVTTLTSKKVDGSTTSMTFTLDSSTAPTSITRAS